MGEAKQILADFPDIKVSEKVQKVLDTLPDEEQVIFSLMLSIGVAAVEQPEEVELKIIKAACLPSGTKEDAILALETLDRRSFKFEASVYPFSNHMLTAYDFMFYTTQGGYYDLPMLRFFNAAAHASIELNEYLQEEFKKP